MNIKSIINRFAGDSKDSPDDEEIFEFVGEEIENGKRRTGLWTKALADADWDEGKAKALYTKYRVEQVKLELRTAAVEPTDGPALSKSEVFRDLKKPITKERYMAKYGTSEKRFYQAVGFGKLRAYRQGDVIWVEDKKIGWF